MSIITKKVQIIPVGDANERNRAYTYIKDGIYNQYGILNTLMSQVGSLYYEYNRDISSKEFNDKLYALFRVENEAIKNFEQPKGLATFANAGRKVQADFSTALKNGLARGERKLPTYKRDFPLLVRGSALHFYSEEEAYVDDEGISRDRTVYYIKMPNKLLFKVVITKKAVKDYYFLPLLDNICNDPEHYIVGQSSIQLDTNGKIILNLAVKIEKAGVKYEPIKGKAMGVALGYNRCITVAFSDEEKSYMIGNEAFQQEFIDRRISLQEYYSSLKSDVRKAKGGHGRTRKTEAVSKYRKSERNMVRNYNHILSKKIVNFAIDKKVEVIIIEKPSKEDFENNPIMLRNWSYYELCEFIKYKATSEYTGGGNAIKVILSEKPKRKSKKKKKKNEEETLNIDVNTNNKTVTEETEEPSTVNIDEKIRNICYKCGNPIEEQYKVSKIDEWSSEMYFNCPHCKETIELSFNKAKNLIKFG